MQTVSVIIPTYKNRGGLVNSVESALSQDYEGLIEVIVVDDNDPKSPYRKDTEILMSRYNDNPKVKYIRHEVNKNGAAARNTGIRASMGDLIAFLDDDDLFLAGKLSKQVKYLECHKDKSAVYCHARRGNTIASTAILEGDGSRDILLLQSNFFTPSLMFRREALEAINGFDESFRRHQDYELLLRFFAAGYKIGCIPEVLIEIGKNQGENIPTGEKVNQLKSYFFEKFKSFIEKEDQKTPGFANKVYAKHYAGVFLNHIRHKHLIHAMQTFTKYFFKSPITFISVLFKSVVVHLKGNA